ncbi:zf-HC2 domain-containing protein [Amycolatopsis camponoti]|uniref:zf-HC2 domain-containing protein n=1 Tax=Amycolatopsis camponoti TaxID=2606593 RepID=UPI001E605B5D|nr:zf-HC2 domain-containing protein [Amycolatopsis camponoti]
MDCALFRESLSAAMDGETGPLPEAEVERHLRGCGACQAWQDQARRLRRSMLRQAPAVPDLTAAILERAPLPSREKWAARVALGLVGLVQSGLGFAEFLVPGDTHAGAIHLSNESAAWNLALGIGLLWAALRPRTAGAQLPLVAGFALVLGVASVIDVSDGQVGAGRLLTHSLLVVGLVLMFVVHREQRRRPAPAPLNADALGTDDEVRLPEHDAPAPLAPVRGRFPRRPASRHRAA